jgi:predicted AlkP superfamily pyrophosphatase or phosphodiesterase
MTDHLGIERGVQMPKAKRPVQNFLGATSLAATLCGLSGPTLADKDHFPRERVRSPKVVLISLDGARPDLIQKYLDQGILPRNGGLARLSRGVVAHGNVTATPSLTAVGHIAIATGSTAVHNNIPANTFHPIAAPISSSISGFGAPIGGYKLSPLGAAPHPSAEPLWVRLRRHGKKVVAATWPGADGADIRINNVIVQAAEPTRVTDYTVPFGAFGGLGAAGFSLTPANFAPDPAVAAQLAAAGRFSYSPVLATPAPVEAFSCASATTATCTTASTQDLKFEIRVAALDTTNDGVVNYDTLVFFEKTQGIQAGPFHPPATGPAYVTLGGRSAGFFFKGTGNKIGAAYFVSALAPDLSTIRFVRYSASYIPRNAPVVADVDDINNHVGFWRPQPDYRIPERLSPGFTDFPDLELEAVYKDQVKTFVQYQADVAERAILRNPGADLVMSYIEQPDGSSHQFLLADRRQATDPRDASSIGDNQDQAKIARYRSYLEFAYQQADLAIARIVAAAGPSSNIIVVSDHGFAPFHTAVNMTNILRNAGIDTSQFAIRTSGAAVNIYINLQGREPGGSVDPATYQTLVTRISTALKNAFDPNDLFNFSLKHKRIFTTVESRPLSCDEGIGRCTSDKIGQDFGDVFAQLAQGYNFDGIQSPVVVRQGDPAFDSAKTIFSVPNFYGSHGHDSNLKSMRATFLAAGPGVRRHKTIGKVRNIDVAPTIMHLLGVRPGATIDGRVLHEVLR